jgi:hypothetical protein
MPDTMLEAKAALEAQGLHVRSNGEHSLWIAGNVRDAGNGIKVSDDACYLNERANRWVAVFPARQSLTYEIPGSLPELVALITAVYARHRGNGGALGDAVREVVNEPDQYLIGRTLTGV